MSARFIKTGKTRCKPYWGEEDKLTRAIIDYCRVHKIDVSHIANEGQRSRSYGHKLKLMGLRPGEPDLMFCYGCKKQGTLYLELKAPGKKPTTLQFKRLEQLKVQGNTTAWVDNFDDAVKIIDNYIKNLVI